MDRQRVLRIVEAVKASGVSELCIREGDSVVRVRVSASGVETDKSVVRASGPESAVATAPTNGGSNGSSGGGLVEVRTRIVGFFHHGKEADGEPLVRVGDRVVEGQVVGTVEALSMVTDVVSSVSGEVVAVEVEDGHAVQYGDILMRIRPDGAQ